MTKVVFYWENEIPLGFHIAGHSTAGAGDEQGRLVCAAVSSAAYLTANTLTEIIGAAADIRVDDAIMDLRVKSGAEDCVAVLSGFFLHMEQLAAQYPDYVTINTEV